MNPTLYKKLPYDPGKDLILAALICNVPFVLVVNPSLPVHSVADLVKLAKEQPLSYGSGGAGAFHHLMGELFKIAMGVPMTHVPYKGTLPALNDVIAGHIQLMFSDLAPAYPLIQAGKVRALGVTTAQRAPAAPELPRSPKSVCRASTGRPGNRWRCRAIPQGHHRQAQRRGERGGRRARGHQAAGRPSVHSRRQGFARGARRASWHRRPRAGPRSCKSRRGRIGVGRTSGPERRPRRCSRF